MGRILCYALVATLIAGCAGTDPSNESIILPQLIEQTSLPAHPDMLHSGFSAIEVQVLIAADGSVSRVLLLTPSRDARWDSNAVHKIMEWKYAPAKYHGNPVRLWIRQRISIKYEEIVSLFLAEIVCDTEELADSVHQMLGEGLDFGEAAKRFSIAESGKREGILGEVDGGKFPEVIQRTLKKLSKGEYTKPLRMGQKFVILMKIL